MRTSMHASWAMRPLVGICAALLVTAGLCTTVTQAQAEEAGLALIADQREPITYVDTDGNVQTTSDYTPLADAEQDNNLVLTDGCYFLPAGEELRVDHVSPVSGDVTIILEGKLMLFDILEVGEGSSLAILDSADASGVIDSHYGTSDAILKNTGGELYLRGITVHNPITSGLDAAGGHSLLYHVTFAESGIGYGIDNAAGATTELIDTIIPSCGGGGVRNRGTLIVSGATVIEKGNANWWEPREFGVLLEESSYIEPRDLTDGAHIAVTIGDGDGTGAFTKGFAEGCGDDDPSAYFTVDASDCAVTRTANGEVGIVRTKGDAAKGAAVAIEDVSLDWDAGIGMTFWAGLPELPEDAGDDYCMEFTIGGKRARTVRVPLDEGAEREDGLRGYTFPVATVELAQPVTATVHCGRHMSEEKVSSVKDCIKSLVDGGRGAVDAHEIELAKALADVGHYVQPFFAACNDWTVGTDYQPMDLFYTKRYRHDDFERTLAKHHIVCETKDSDIVKVECSLELGPHATMRVYLTPKEDASIKGRARFGNRLFGPEEQKDGRYLISVTDITPQEFTTEMIFGVGSYDGDFDIRISPYAYLLCVWYKYSDKPEYRNAIASVVEYNRIAGCYQ